VFTAAALILGDGLYNLVKILRRTTSSFISAVLKGPESDLPISDDERALTNLAISFDDERRTAAFVKDHIPLWVAYGCSVVIATLSIATVPRIFPPLKWYHILVAHVLAPLLAFCNAYGCGLTDWNAASTYGKLAIFIFGPWAGASHGGVLAGLAACGVIMSIAATASVLMQSFRTGYLTLTSPRSMLVSQVIGTAMGCVISPCVFWLFYKAFDDIGIPGSQYPAPYALMYRNMAIVGVDGFSSLPKHCLSLCCLFFALGIAINLAKDVSPGEVARLIPIPVAMAIPFYIGASFAIDMCIGSVILYVWTKMNKAKADAFGPAVASGLICGDGMWSIPQGVLALAQVRHDFTEAYGSLPDEMEDMEMGRYTEVEDVNLVAVVVHCSKVHDILDTGCLVNGKGPAAVLHMEGKDKNIQVAGALLVDDGKLAGDMVEHSEDQVAEKHFAAGWTAQQKDDYNPPFHP
ncbi:hypothetical protein BHE74_00041491, partial [Ensete ventricosum]